MDNINGVEILKKIERCGRTCYQSQDKITEDSAKRFVAMVLKRGHESVIEHSRFVFRVDTDSASDILPILMA
jgi:thymidylate synthase (FAD)